MSSLNYFFFVGQDVDRPIGGLKQIYRVANCLAELGYNIFLVQGTSEFLPSWFIIQPLFSRLSLQSFKERSFSYDTDVIIIPETFILQYFKFPPLRRIVFNQNAGYTFGEKLNIKPEFVHKVYSDSLLAGVLCVSFSDFRFLTESLALPASKVKRIYNSIESNIFYPECDKQKIISFMPRKNPEHCRIVTSLISRQDWFVEENWSLLPIERCSHVAVADHLRKSFIFLSLVTQKALVASC